MTATSVENAPVAWWRGDCFMNFSERSIRTTANVIVAPDLSVREAGRRAVSPSTLTSAVTTRAWTIVGDFVRRKRANWCEKSVGSAEARVGGFPKINAHTRHLRPQRKTLSLDNVQVLPSQVRAFTFLV